MAREIVLNAGMKALVSDEDYEIVSAFKWRAFKPNARCLGHYVVGRSGRDGKQVLMHRLILNAPKGSEIDHINHDPLDNRRENLRFATRSQQCANMRAPRRTGATLGLKGIYRRRCGSWMAQIQVKGTRQHGPARRSDFEAALDYDRMAIEAFGEFASVNFPCRHRHSVDGEA